jgi:hypothetical protein
MTLNVSVSISFDNTYDREGMREKAVEINSTKSYTANDITCS